MSAPEPARGRANRLTFGQLVLLTYAAGYVLYLVPALIWGWRQGMEPLLGFALWQILLYAPLWPFVLFAQIYQFLIPLL